ncbi:hypothetical protein MLD38_010931 [Melastoma candidum]|uniref:Uncharacterized protein n=1 Tax=Melastoma candidum TaxID=119954 RepID=A0ACB9R129_9MYRT|nr:hypothetical protein MLD38_010931 [Melastoma candidum]
MSIQRKAEVGMFLSSRSMSVILCVAVLFVSTVRAPPNVAILSIWCGPIPMALQSPVSNAIFRVVEDLKENTSRHNNNYWTRKTYVGLNGERRCFGQATCNVQPYLWAQDCLECLRVAKVQIILRCQFKISAWVQLQDCYMRFGCETP